MVIFMIDLKGKKFLRNVELLTHAKYSDKHHRLRAPLWPRIFSPRTRSDSTAQQGFIWWLAALHQNLKSSLHCFLHQTLWTHTTRVGSTISNITSNHGTKTPPFWDWPLHPPTAPKSLVQWTHLPPGPVPPPSQLWGASHHYSCLATYSLHLCPSAALRRRQAGTADTQGWGRAEEEWAESRPRYMFSDYKISVFLFKVLSVNIPYYRRSTTVSTDCQY